MARYLQEIGFTDGEERVYLALLKLGTSKTGPIAKEAGISRSKLYEVLEKLVRKGIVSHFTKNNISHYSAMPPQRITEYLENKEKEFKIKKEEFVKTIPILQSLGGSIELSKEAQVFEGMDGIKNVRELALRTMRADQTMYYFGNPASGHNYVLGYWDDWNDRRIKKKIESKIIYNQDATEFGERRKNQKYTQIRYLPQKGQSDAWVEIYDDILAIVIKKETPMSIVIRNKLVAQSFLTYFSVLWAASKKKI